MCTDRIRKGDCMHVHGHIRNNMRISIKNRKKKRPQCTMKREKTVYYMKIFLLLVCSLLVFCVIFYFSCGEALYIRESDGNVEEFYATNDTGELTEGLSAEQIYTSQMDLIDVIGVRITNYGRPRTGDLHVRCEAVSDGHLIAEDTFSMQTLEDGQYVYLYIPKGAEEPRGSQVRILCTSNSTPGNAPMILYNAENMLENKDVARNARLLVNGEDVAGTMCIVVQGRDRVWTGPNYWKLVSAAVLLVVFLYFLAVYRWETGKCSCLFMVLGTLEKYSFLIRQLVARDFKVRYKRSVLGVFWSFLNPLFTMIVQYFVFSQLFRSDIENYPVYLLSGLVVFNFFGEGVGQALGSIVGNASLITKVYVPKYIYPVTRVLSSGINLLMSLIPLVIAAIFTGERITKAYMMLPYILACVMVFTVGFGMILAAGMAFFRDVQFLWGIINMLWMYLTPLFYPISIVPDGFRQVIMNNPMYLFVRAVRIIVLDGTVPQPVVFAQCTVTAFVMLMAGIYVFRKTQDKFIFYI